MNTLALLGQPNCGKSTLFNGLTGSHQHVGNWPGKTVERSEGEFTVGEKQFHVVDLPGSYSLSANSDEEIITRDYISSGKADAVLIMADASQLTRSLYMLADYIGMETPAILVLNMMDVAKGKGIIIDEKKLGENLGIPVVSMVAADKKTYKELYKKVTGEKIGVVISKSALEEKTAGIDKKNTLALANAKYAWIESVLNGVVTKQKGKSHFGKFDRVATSRVWGKPLAILITLLTFVGGFILATPIMMLGQAIPQYLHEPLFNVMTKLGLQGKAVMPMLMGTVCTIGSASGSRVIDNWGQRVLLLAVAWAVPCGATWSLMPTMASMFFGSIGAIGVMILILAVMALMIVIVAKVFGRKLSPKEKRVGMIMELPPYHKPHWKNILRVTLDRAIDVFKKAFSVIMLVSIVFFFLSYSGGNTEGSIIYKIGSAIEPVTHIFGLKWQAFAAFIASAVSKEATMGVLSSLYANTGDILGSTLALKGSTYSTDTLATILPQVMTKAESLAFIVACSFNMPCVMALSATAKEVHSVKWTAKIALFYTVMSLVLAGITYQIANIFL